MDMYLLSSRAVDYLSENIDLESLDDEPLCDLYEFLARGAKIGVTKAELFSQGFNLSDIENIMMLGSFKSDF